MPQIPPRKAEFFKALAHPVRIRVLEELGAGNATVSELRVALDLEQSHLSQHLGILRRAGFVTSRREGASVRYAIADERITDLLQIARQILLDTAAQAQRDLAAL